MLTQRPPDLPDFSNPPVSEVVFSIQFDSLDRFSAAHIGVLWGKFRERFPVVEEHLPMAPVVERFDLRSSPKVQVRLEERPPTPRVWFLNENSTELIQVQQDRFLHNWRKVQGLETYPRYEPIREHFEEEVEALMAFLRDENLGTLTVNQCELTYVNHISTAGSWERHGQLHQVLRNWRPLEGTELLPEPEDIGLNIRFAIPGEPGAKIGRLNVSVQPAWRTSDRSPALVMNLTARGEPLGEGMPGAFRFFDLARNWIVKGFADLTTEEMHRAWNRVDR
jgi:uncharacterized protein (TIGR04255 family)